MHVFNVMCPSSVTIYLNGSSDNEKIVRVIDTIDVYDEIEVIVSSKSMVSKIYLNGMLLIGNNLITKAINSFFNYTKLPPQGISVKIDKKVPYQLDSNGLDSIAAGVILALNMYYHLNLSDKDLYEIATHISLDVYYYIVGGYHKIKSNNDMVYHNKSIHDSYLIAVSKSKDNWSEGINIDDFQSDVSYNNRFYNCLEQMAPDELRELKDKLLELKADKVCINGINNSIVAHFYNHHDRFNAKEELKKQKVKSLVVQPCDGIKIRHRYI